MNVRVGSYVLYARYMFVFDIVCCVRTYVSVYSDGLLCASVWNVVSLCSATHHVINPPPPHLPDLARRALRWQSKTYPYAHADVNKSCGSFLEPWTSLAYELLTYVWILFLDRIVKFAGLLVLDINLPICLVSSKHSVNDTMFQPYVTFCCGFSTCLPCKSSSRCSVLASLVCPFFVGSATDALSQPSRCMRFNAAIDYLYIVDASSEHSQILCFRCVFRPVRGIIRVCSLLCCFPFPSHMRHDQYS